MGLELRMADNTEVGKLQELVQWPKSALRELVEPSSPITYGVVKPGQEDPDGVLFVRGGDIANGRIAVEQLRTITVDVSQQYRRTTLRGGELLVSLVGNPGQVAIVPETLAGANLARQVALVRLGKGVDTQYVKYFLSAPLGQASLGGHSLGSVQQVINLRDLRTVEIPLPPLPEQRAIAHVLGSLDDKIEINRRMSETLEAMARALFRSWFVDFEPVRAKMEGRWRPGESLPGLLAEHYHLFPDTLVPSPLGDIPEGWEVRGLGECYRLTMGQSPPGDTYNDQGDGLPFFQGRSDFGFRYPTNRVFCSAPSRTAETGDTMVSVRAPVGDVNMAWEKSCIGRGVAALRHSSGASSFTYYSVRMMQPDLQQYEHTGTVFGAITGKQFASMQVVVPPLEVINCFETLVLPWDEHIRVSVAEARHLATQRDTLLPRLLSGEVPVRM